MVDPENIYINEWLTLPCAKGYETSSIQIPDYMLPGFAKYIILGIPPGNFLTAILTNDLMEAVGRADDTNINLIPNYCHVLYNYTPSGCYGSPEAFRKWVSSGGLKGIMEEFMAKTLPSSSPPPE